MGSLFGNGDIDKLFGKKVPNRFGLYEPLIPWSADGHAIHPYQFSGEWYTRTEGTDSLHFFFVTEERAYGYVNREWVGVIPLNPLNSLMGGRHLWSLANSEDVLSIISDELFCRYGHRDFISTENMTEYSSTQGQVFKDGVWV